MENLAASANQLLTKIPFTTHADNLHLRLNDKTMFHQFIGDGANVFIAISSVIIGFATALGFVDFKRTTKGEKDDH